MVQLLSNSRHARTSRVVTRQAPPSQAVTRQVQTERVVTQGAPGVLIADDDPEMRQLIHEALVQAGFNRVFEARDGSECIATLQQYPDSIRAIILDLMMPNLSGAHVLEQLGGSNPAPLSILLISGHADSLSVLDDKYRDTQLPLRVETLGKPFEADELVGKLKRMIMAEGGPSALVGLGAPSDATASTQQPTPLQPTPSQPTPLQPTPSQPPPVMQPMQRTVEHSAPAATPIDLDNLRKQLATVEGQLAGLNTAVAQLRRAFDGLSPR